MLLFFVFEMLLFQRWTGDGTQLRSQTRKSLKEINLQPSDFIKEKAKLLEETEPLRVTLLAGGWAAFGRDIAGKNWEVERRSQGPLS